MSAPELEALREAAVASERLAGHLRRLQQRLTGTFPTGADIDSWDDQERERLHAFFHMFEQLYDLIARRMLRGVLLLAQEDSRSLSYKAVVRRAETLTGIDGNRWLGIAETRNNLVHEYATSGAVQADQANRAWLDLPSLLETHAQLLQHLMAEGLFE